MSEWIVNFFTKVPSTAIEMNLSASLVVRWMPYIHFVVVVVMLALVITGFVVLLLNWRKLFLYVIGSIVLIITVVFILGVCNEALKSAEDSNYRSTLIFIWESVKSAMHFIELQVFGVKLMHL